MSQKMELLSPVEAGITDHVESLNIGRRQMSGFSFS